MEKNIIPKVTSSLQEWLCYIQNLHNKTIELGLDRVQQVASNLDLFTPAATVFTVAGTNGKGTTCCMLEAILLETGLRIGVYSSPHLIRYTERVRIQGKEPTESEFIYSFAAVENERNETSLTYFEFSTLSALYLFKQAQLDVVILEVGLGGRLDATNIIDSSVAVITSVALDHIDWLGTDRESIGKEKAGIFRSHKPAVIGEPKILTSIVQIATSLGTPIYQNGIDWMYSRQVNHWQWKNGKILLTNLPIPNVPIINAATAIAALSYSTLDIGYQAIYSGLQKAMLPGRFQCVCHNPRLILDVAHNPHAASYLAKTLETLPRKGGKVRAVLGMMSDKDIAGTLTCLFEQVDEWYCASINEPRGAPSEFLSQYLRCSRQFIDVQTAWRQAMQDAHKQDIVIVFGSFHAVGQIMIALQKKKNNINSYKL